ncbi:MAG: hypothetical protein IPJ06_14860, partial [Saprospiraceae bacterium]|nr:hypothetical protein [Saprospiraceae bacterium]
MRRNYAAALQDDAQQVLNNWMKTSVDKLQDAAEAGQKGLAPKTVHGKGQVIPPPARAGSRIAGQQAL